jgi:hypothetical protein
VDGCGCVGGVWVVEVGVDDGDGAEYGCDGLMWCCVRVVNGDGGSECDGVE